MNKWIIRTLPTILLLIGAFIVLSGCEKEKEAKKKEEEAKNISVSSVAQGYINKIYREGNIVVKSQQKLNDYIEELQIPNSPQINFDTDMVIGVIETNNSSSTVDITNITEFKDKVEVRVENSQKGMTADIGCIYHIVKIPKTDKPIVFIKITVYN